MDPDLSISQTDIDAFSYFAAARPRYPPDSDLRDLPRIWLLDVSCLGGYARRDKLDLGS